MNTNHITINTQSSISIEGEKKLYFDPFSMNSENHDADFIFITHDHSDHFSIEDVRKIMTPETILVAPTSMKKEITSAFSENECRIFLMNPGQAKEFSRILIETVPAYNTQKSFHPKKKQWLGYIITMAGIRYYISGDTDVTSEAKQVRCDIAFVPIGGTYTMTAKEAASLMHAIGPRIAIPTHYGSLVGEEDAGTIFESLVPHNVKVELKLQF